MKKFFKMIIALAIIGGIAFGAFVLFNNGTNNKDIHTKIYNLTNLEVDGVNIYTTTNQTITSMVDLINTKNYNLPNILADFEVFASLLEDYEEIRMFVEENRIYVNNANTNPYFKNMKKACDKVEKLYKEGYDYLKTTYLAITNEEHYNKDYIENFYNVFKDALVELNNFYTNAGIAMVYGSNNMMSFNNKYKLEIHYYCAALSHYVQNYITQTTPVEGAEAFNYSEFISQKNAKLDAIAAKMNSVTFSSYLINKQKYDDLIANKKLNKEQLVANYLEGKVEEFLNSITDEAQKAIAENYLTLVIEG